MNNLLVNGDGPTLRFHESSNMNIGSEEFDMEPDAAALMMEKKRQSNDDIDNLSAPMDLK